MAKYSVVSVFDMVAMKYKQPMFEVNKGTAVRNFKFACENVPNVPNEDIQLELVAEFDDETGNFMPVKHEIIAKGAFFQKVGVNNDNEEE